MPSDVLDSPFSEIVGFLFLKFGENIGHAFDHNVQIESPVSSHINTDWTKTMNCVGINVRTIGSFWKIIPYVLTLPTAQNSIHILPIWEPGVVASLYGPSSWNINPEFFSAEMQHHFPHLDTVEKQLKVVVNVLHLLGKAVGMDVVPHTDRYSEQVLANPQHFEWLVRKDLDILDHRSDLHETVQDTIMQYLEYRGSAVPGISYPKGKADFFGEKFPEEARLRVLFGEKYDYEGRLKNRNVFVSLFYEMGLETVPATMAPPYRGLEVDPDPLAKTIDDEGRVWRDYRITKPQKMSRVFGPLSRFKLYETKAGNENWELDFSRPRTDTWEYVCRHYRDIQAEFGFDFMRGDMSHVQMRPDGVPIDRDGYYDLLGAVKQAVLKEKPYFGYFAESFLAPPNEMAYGDECDHLEASFADSTLGDLQSEPVGTPEFKKIFLYYRHLLETRQFAPNFTVMTADKDDPRFDKFYLKGNELRYFMALFMQDMPSYMGLGFECRDTHPVPAPNEHYTKLYVFHLDEGPKSTQGPYQWGKNRQLYHQIVRVKKISETIFHEIADKGMDWIGMHGDVAAWTQTVLAKYIFLANFDVEKDAPSIQIPKKAEWAECQYSILFSTHSEDLGHLSMVATENYMTVSGLKNGECIILELLIG